MNWPQSQSWFLSGVLVSLLNNSATCSVTIGVKFCTINPLKNLNTIMIIVKKHHTGSDSYLEVEWKKWETSLAVSRIRQLIFDWQSKPIRRSAWARRYEGFLKWGHSLRMTSTVSFLSIHSTISILCRSKQAKNSCISSVLVKDVEWRRFLLEIIPSLSFPRNEGKKETVAYSLRF